MVTHFIRLYGLFLMHGKTADNQPISEKGASDLSLARKSRGTGEYTFSGLSAIALYLEDVHQPPRAGSESSQSEG